ncbi:hypothetical protein FA95DRAFT_375493 [Auriscalpium vulgare]|uniref:Uncharacterized protein n=1 Tax=Auriscalpium vulgare TaxID=40419 RepID=A0ACB8RIV7_9AGAM|nr:hypothetical protein FA95DRAFT_375493 [Auriscalpium vulgare]
MFHREFRGCRGQGGTSTSCAVNSRWPEVATCRVSIFVYTYPDSMVGAGRRILQRSGGRRVRIDAASVVSWTSYRVLRRTITRGGPLRCCGTINTTQNSLPCVSPSQTYVATANTDVQKMDAALPEATRALVVHERLGSTSLESCMRGGAWAEPAAGADERLIPPD